jgi:hypothetical protein
MNRARYLTGPVANFRDWLAQKLCGDRIDFAVRGASAYADLPAALAAYRWPHRAKAGLSTSGGGPRFVYPLVPMLPANSNLAANTHVLNIIQNSIREAYVEGTPGKWKLAGAVAAIFHWGGVYTARGNKGWLAENQSNLLAALRAVIRDHALGDDVSGIRDLRFTSGMTKIYSLLIDDFVIYDSRVAAALAWLIKRWWTECSDARTQRLPELLQVTCPAANGAMAPHRNPDLQMFRTIRSNAALHYTWNVRANWLLSSALRQAGSGTRFGSLREIEAALFQMGDRVV